MSDLFPPRNITDPLGQFDELDRQHAAEDRFTTNPHALPPKVHAAESTLHVGDIAPGCGPLCDDDCTAHPTPTEIGADNRRIMRERRERDAEQQRAGRGRGWGTGAGRRPRGDDGQALRQTSVALHDEVIRAADDLAADLGLTRADVLRMWITAGRVAGQVRRAGK